MCLPRVCICACVCVAPGPSEHQALGSAVNVTLAVRSTAQTTDSTRAERTGGRREEVRIPELARPYGVVAQPQFLPTAPPVHPSPPPLLESVLGVEWRTRKKAVKERQSPGTGLDHSSTVPVPLGVRLASEVSFPDSTSACCSRGRPSVNCPIAQAREIIITLLPSIGCSAAD